MSQMIELLGWESVPSRSGLKGLCCHGSPLYEEAQTSILSTWIGILLLLPYKTWKLLILIRDPCAYMIRTSLPFLKIFCLEGQTPCCPWTLMEHRSVSTCTSAGHRTSFEFHDVLPVQNLWAAVKKEYLLKIKGQGTNVIPNLLFLRNSPRSVTLEMCPWILLGRLCMRNFQVSPPLSFITEYLSLFILIFFFSYNISETVYTKTDLKGLEEFRNGQVQIKPSAFISPLEVFNKPLIIAGNQACVLI